MKNISNFIYLAVTALFLAISTSYALPTVTIVASDATATESGTTTGQYTVTITTATEDVTIHYSVGGTATAGSDYVTLSGTMVISSGTQVGQLTVTPINDSVVEGAETVVVSLTTDAAYEVGAGSVAVVTITSDDVAALPAPKNVKGTPNSQTAISWRWDLVEGASYYAIYSANNEWKSETATTGWTEQGLLKNTKYERYVKAFISTGNPSDKSVPVSVYTLANSPYEALVSSVTSGGMYISWSNDNCTAFKIERSINSDMSEATVVKDWSDRFGSTLYYDGGLTPNTDYYYAVWGYNGDGIITSSSTKTNAKTLKTRVMALDMEKDGNLEETRLVGNEVREVKVEIPANSTNEQVTVEINIDPINNPVKIDKKIILAANSSIRSENDKQLAQDSAVEFIMYDISGSQLTNFNNNVKITIPYPDADNDGYVDGANPRIRANELKAFVLSEETGKWVKLGGTVDEVNKTVIIYINHFSLYTIMSAGQAATTLDLTATYPNPYKPGSGGKYDNTAVGAGIVFTRLTQRVNIKIFTVAGELVREIDTSTTGGEYLWDVKNAAGLDVASGVYVYLIKDVDGASANRKGKIAIIR